MSCTDQKKMSICSYCSRMKRGILYGTCRREGYNVLAMGQHLDDLAESFLMSAFHNGCLRTMKANYHAEAGDIRIIRPLCYVRERLTREYADLHDLPIIEENCPACFEAPKERARVKVVLAEQEHAHPALFSSLLRAMKPLMALENNRLKTGDGDDEVSPPASPELQTILQAVHNSRAKGKSSASPTEARRANEQKSYVATRSSSRITDNTTSNNNTNDEHKNHWMLRLPSQIPFVSTISNSIVYHFQDPLFVAAVLSFALISKR